MRQYFMCVVSLLLVGANSFAVYTPKDSIDGNDEKITSLIIGADYSTNTNTFGRFDDISAQPSYSPYISFYHKWGFNLGAAGYFIGNSDSSGSKTTSELDLQASYTWKLNSLISINPSYNHFFYSKNSTVLKRSYNDYAQLAIVGSKKWWSGSVSAKYLWGDYDEMMLTAQTDAIIKINHVFGRDNTLVLQPTIEVNMSDINYYRYISGKFKFLRAYADLFPDDTFADLLVRLQKSSRPLVSRLAERIAANPYLQKRLNKLATDESLVISDLFSNKKELKFSSLGLTLPVYYYWGDFIFNVSFTAYKPYNQPKIFGNDWVTFVSAGISYTLDWP